MSLCEAAREQGQEDCGAAPRYRRAISKHCTLCFRGISSVNRLSFAEMQKRREDFHKESEIIIIPPTCFSL